MNSSLSLSPHTNIHGRGGQGCQGWWPCWHNGYPGRKEPLGHVKCHHSWAKGLTSMRKGARNLEAREAQPRGLRLQAVSDHQGGRSEAPPERIGQWDLSATRHLAWTHVRESLGSLDSKTTKAIFFFHARGVGHQEESEPPLYDKPNC